MLLQNAVDMYETTGWMMIELKPAQHRLLSINQHIETSSINSADHQKHYNLHNEQDNNSNSST